MSDRVVPTLGVLLFLAGAYVVFLFPLHHDLAWYLYAAGRMLDGARLYVDLVEVNPPLIVWLTTAVEAAARLSGAWGPTLYRLLVLTVGALALLACRPLLARALPDASLARDASVLLCAYLFTAFAGFEFGQREHIALILVLPYVLAAAARGTGGATPRAAALAIGGAAGLGIAMKPYFVPVWLAIEGWLACALWRRGAASRGLRRPEHVALLGVGTLYVGTTFLIHPEYLDLLAWGAPLYAGFDARNLVELVASDDVLLVATGSLVGLLAPLAPRLRPLSRLLGFVTLAFAAAVLLQGKGWGYHWMPARAVALLTLTVAATDVFERMPLPRRAQLRDVLPIATLVAVLAAANAQRTRDAGIMRLAMRGYAYQLPAMLTLAERHAPSGSVAALSTNLAAAFPLVYLIEGRWGLRYNALWPLPALYDPQPRGRERPFPYRAPTAMSAPERRFFTAVVEDLIASRPELLIIDHRPPGRVLAGFDYLEYFGQDPRFRALLQEYEPVAQPRLYTVYRRLPARPDP